MRELALHILDLLQNSVEAGAGRVDLNIEEDAFAGRLRITVRDDGRGMNPETAGRVTDPFFTTRTTRHVGLGLPLLAAAAERAGGSLTIHSAPAAGTTVDACFQLGHPDLQPLGDMASTLLAFLLSEMAPELHYSHYRRVLRGPRSAEETFEFDSAEIRATLGGLPLTHPAVRRWLAEFLQEGETWQN